jgi:hypothetical protein
MNRLREGVALALLVVMAAASSGHAVPDAMSVRSGRAGKIDNAGHMDINNMDFVVTNHGSLMYDIPTGNPGLIYPRGTTKAAIFAAGLWLGAKINDSLRVTVGEYSQEFSPGPMANGTFQQDRPEFRIYRIERGNTTSEDYINWPVDQGAPVDSAGNPLLLGDVTLWTVYNDADPSVHSNDAGNSLPLGIEVQQTVFAFNQANPLADCAFMKFLLINKGSNTLDSMFITFWSDPDLGDASDDLVGCDTTRSLGYCYNATNTDPIYGAAVPAVGFDYFQGPLVNGERLPMTSFAKYINGTDPRAADDSYNYMRGLNADGTPYMDSDGVVTRFQLAGDPVTGVGDIDANPADRRLQLSSGPFVMAPGDTQEIVVGVIVGQGANRLSSIRVLQNNDDFAQAAYDLNFNVAVPPPAPVVSVREFDKAIELDWTDISEDYVSIIEDLNQEYRFQGYNVYQGSSIGGPWTKIRTFDVDDTLSVIYDDLFDPATGAYQRVVVQQGANTGLEYHVRIENDAIRGGELVNNKEYFFAVTAYALDVNSLEPFEVGGAVVGHVSRFPLESGINPLSATPGASGDVLREEAEHVAGPADAQVILEYLDPSMVRDRNYRVVFLQDSTDAYYWRLLDITDGGEGTIVLDNQYNFSGDYSYPVVDGIEIRVIGPTSGAKSIGELCDDDGDGTIDRVKAVDNRTGSGNCTGEWYINTLTGDISGLNRFEPLYNGNHDYEIRFVADTTEYAWDYFGDGDHSLRFPGKMPWQIWDIGINTPDDPADDIRITGMVNESFNPGDPDAWSWYDGIYVRNIPYADVNWEDPAVSSSTYDPTGEKIGYGRLFFFRVAGDTTAPQPAEGTVVRLLTNKTITTEDVFEFRGKTQGSGDGTVVAANSQIFPIPNPYYNRSSYELTQFDRILRFANLPPRRVTIRIFDVGGDLVRTLTRDETSVATLDWNLQNESQITVGSGMYYWVAEVEGGEMQRGTMAVFVEKERLNTY